MRQLLAQGLLAVEGDYGTLVITDACAAVLSRERTVMLRREPERPARAAKQRGGPPWSFPPRRRRLFERLRAWRAAAAKEQGVPAYVVFHDATLREIATTEPTTLAELGTVNGVGETKLARYGEQILETLRTAAA